MMQQPYTMGMGTMPQMGYAMQPQPMQMGMMQQPMMGQPQMMGQP